MPNREAIERAFHTRDGEVIDHLWLYLCRKWSQLNINSEINFVPYPEWRIPYAMPEKWLEGGDWRNVSPVAQVQYDVVKLVKYACTIPPKRPQYPPAPYDWKAFRRDLYPYRSEDTDDPEVRWGYVRRFWSSLFVTMPCLFHEWRSGRLALKRRFYREEVSRLEYEFRHAKSREAYVYCDYNARFDTLYIMEERSFQPAFTYASNAQWQSNRP